MPGRWRKIKRKRRDFMQYKIFAAINIGSYEVEMKIFEQSK